MTPTVRAELQDALVVRSRTDSRIAGAALVGSVARGEDDEWSDIDLALQLRASAPAAEFDEVVADWTKWMAGTTEVVDTLDLRAGGGLYRVFLLGNSLQVDLSFFPYDRFGSASGDPMLIVHGGPAGGCGPSSAPGWRARARWGWLLLLHARSALGRGRPWQAELMLAELRGVVLELAAMRHGLRSDHGRAAHLLPRDVQQRLAESRAASLDADELARSMRLTAECLVAELDARMGHGADRLTQVCRDIAAGKVPD